MIINQPRYNGSASDTSCKPLVNSTGLICNVPWLKNQNPRLEGNVAQELFTKTSHPEKKHTSKENLHTGSMLVSIIE